MHFLHLKAADCSLSSDLTRLNKSHKWSDGLHLWSSIQVDFGIALADFNSGQFKTRLKKMAAHSDFCFFLLAFLYGVLYGAWKLASVLDKDLVYLLSFFILSKKCWKPFFTTIAPGQPTIFPSPTVASNEIPVGSFPRWTRCSLANNSEYWQAIAMTTETYIGIV